MTFSSNEKLYEDFVKCNETVFDEKAIGNSIRNILLTPLGSMPGKPDFGSRLLEVPFSPNDSSTRILATRVVYEALVKWERRIIFLGLKVTQKENTISLDIKYRFRNSSFTGVLGINLLQ